MSKLVVDQKTVYELFGNKNAYFLIPDYQRPYAWNEVECQTLWNDIFSFAIPDNDYSRFNDNDEYFLGPIVTFDNSNQKEVIDGQQRLTTLSLLLRAFYCSFGTMQDENSLETKRMIEACIWKTNEFNKPDKNILKIDSEVASDENKEEFLSILKTGLVEDRMKSNYACNYRFFQKKIEEFLHTFPAYFPYLPIRIMKNCILLPIEAESQDTALRIFSTLNDRGKPLSDADIFKAQLYKHYSSKGEKDVFIKRWKELEAKCNDIYHPIQGTPMDEAFARYMYYERAKLGIKSSSTEALRKFYERDSYALLKRDEVFNSLVDLTDFWVSVSKQDEDRFSDNVLRKLFVLNYAPNSMWTYFVSVYYLSNKDETGKLNEIEFLDFLEKTIAFVWTYAIVYPGVNSLRTPVYAEMINVVNHQKVDFSEFVLDYNSTRTAFDNYVFTNNRAITKAMLTWWAFTDPEQKLLPLDTTLEIEHIYARNRYENERSLEKKTSLEKLGNKSLLEKRINIRASDYRFNDKKKYYRGFESARGYKLGTGIKELVKLADIKDDFVESDIETRTVEIIDAFFEYLRTYNLLSNQ